ncbi:NO-inducible flavohemoprotein [Cohnella sp. AR92]|uniref:NO-inducible flavohemoprotein n=1 Tax=Cohnella sp. AR92 TaxID=648716 RepID=UPI000F8EA1CD|nr:NO-inducible flavohemoprotein [Cohnella sp. AR92]RUS48973.1 NO-inducible flavohemoprotein [Cohnella sp. AR92]
MLSEKTIKVIKSTVPVLEVHGTEITKRFYRMLFSNHPELLNVFNHANQRQGRQQTALANAVYAAAAHIDRLEEILPAVKQIAHKHRSLGITADQYPIVGENLLAAIKDVLGDAATDEIIQAWAEAYGVIADAFIGVEAQMYEEAEKQEGGWAGWREFKVDRKAVESEAITSFYLVPADGKAIASYIPGQYVTVKLNIPGDPYTHLRQYSLSDVPGKPYYRISVKKEVGCEGKPDGKVSEYLHDAVKAGDLLPLTAPAGDFTLDLQDRRPVVLISGGVGLTPTLSMLKTIAEREPERKTIFIHSARNGKLHAMKEEVEELARSHPQIRVYWNYSRPTDEDKGAHAYHHEGFIDAEWLRNLIPSEGASYYFCGPVAFMQAINAALKSLGIPDSDIHYEFFGPKGALSGPVAETA